MVTLLAAYSQSTTAAALLDVYEREAAGTTTTWKGDVSASVVMQPGPGVDTVTYTVRLVSSSIFATSTPYPPVDLAPANTTTTACVLKSTVGVGSSVESIAQSSVRLSPEVMR